MGDNMRILLKSEWSGLGTYGAADNQLLIAGQLACARNWFCYKKDMDPESLTSWAVATTSVIKAVRTAIDAIPSGPKKAKAEHQLELAERAMKEAEAVKARDLGYELCFRSYPPHTMAMKRIGSVDCWWCPTCELTWDGRSLEDLAGEDPA